MRRAVGGLATRGVEGDVAILDGHYVAKYWIIDDAPRPLDLTNHSDVVALKTFRNLRHRHASDRLLEAFFTTRNLCMTYRPAGWPRLPARSRSTSSPSHLGQVRIGQRC